MRYKFLAFDLDGTLLQSDGTIEENTLRLIKTLHSRMHLILCSGRHFFEIKRYILEIELDKNDFIICNDGRYTMNADGHIIFESPSLSGSDIEKIYYLTNFESLSAFCDNYDILLTHNFLKKIIIKMFMKSNTRNIIVVSRLDEINNLNVDICKIVVNFDTDSDTIITLKKYYTVHLYPSGRCEILNINCNKYEALKKLNDAKMININQMLYFGDGVNDYECFNNLPYCIAMGNADETIKKMAINITDTNDNKGIYNALNKIFAFE